MNREDIIRIARECGFWLDGANQAMPTWVIKQEELERFAALVASAEREACAKVCEEQAKEYASMAAWKLCNECANAIRARGQA